MNPLIRLIGEISLKVRSAEELVEAERYKKRLASCGRNVRIGKNCNMIPEHIHVGNNVVIGMGSYLIASIAHIHIGNNVMMGPQVVIRGITDAICSEDI